MSEYYQRIVKLPRWAIMAFGARCGRRLLSHVRRPKLKALVLAIEDSAACRIISEFIFDDGTIDESTNGMIDFGGQVVLSAVRCVLAPTKEQAANYVSMAATILEKAIYTYADDPYDPHDYGAFAAFEAGKLQRKRHLRSLLRLSSRQEGTIGTMTRQFR